MAKTTFAFGFIFLQFFLLIHVDAQNGDCRTQEGSIGACISIRQCPPLWEILTKRPLSQSAVAYLRRAQCSFSSSDPIVCCPFENGSRDSNRNDQNNGQSGNINLRNNPLLYENCGSDLSQRIVGGEITELDEFPWMTLLEYRKPTGITTACGGVLISRRYVMTAAHCLKGKDLPRTWRLISVRLGEYDTSTDRDCVSDGDDSEVCADQPLSIPIEEQIAHEQYKPNSRNQRYDIALLRLSRDVPFTRFIKPICLPSNATFPQKLHVAGWGRTETKSESNVKLKLGLNVADQGACEQTYRNVGVSLSAGQVCAGGQRGKDSCRGDSGGPLMSVERTPNGSGRWTVVGIVSFGPSPCGMQGWPGVYSKVSDFVPWALGKMRA